MTFATMVTLRRNNRRVMFGVPGARNFSEQALCERTRGEQGAPSRRCPFTKHSCWRVVEARDRAVACMTVSRARLSAQ